MWNGDYLSAILRTAHFKAKWNRHVADNRSWENKRRMMKVPTFTLLNTAETWKWELPVQQTSPRKRCSMSPVPLCGNVRESLDVMRPPKAQKYWVLTSFSGSSLFPFRVPPTPAQICIQTQWISSLTWSISLFLSTICSHFLFSKSAKIMQFDIRGFLIQSNREHSWRKKKGTW